MPESEDWPEGKPIEAPDRERAVDARTGSPAAAARIQQQHLWVDQQIRVAMAKGEFDDLPGAGKPIKGLGGDPDPEWWLKRYVEREQIAVLPLSLQLRKEDAELDGRLDRLASERQVREALEDFNERVVAARYQLPEGPPLITMPRDVEDEVTAWRERRDARQRALAERARAARAEKPARRWWRRRTP